MIKIEAVTLEKAYTDAAKALECSVSELKVEIVQVPRDGVLGFFKKSAIIVATAVVVAPKNETKNSSMSRVESKSESRVEHKSTKKEPKAQIREPKDDTQEQVNQAHRVLKDTIMPISFVSDQDDEDEDLKSGLEYTADYDDEFDESCEEDSTQKSNLAALVHEVEEEINNLFRMTCFSIDKIEVSLYDEQTLLVEFKGEDAALLIGKEGYRYKALSYMIFNWLNSKYDIQLRLEIAEFLKNQEESVGRYLANVYENIERDGRAQTKILDGVLVQIALKELRERYPEKYVVIRSTKDGLKYIIVNDYHSN